MPAEPPPERSIETAPTAAPEGDASSTAAAPPPRLSAAELAAAERRLNAPTPLTLRLLGVVFVATLLPWVGAKTACNLRESPVRQPHDLPAETLAKSAKGAALELSQRAASGRYREAAELASGDLAQELLAADERCQREPAPCERRRTQLERTFTRAVVASRGPFEANVRTESQVGDDPPERFAMYLTKQDGRWYVVRRSPLEGPIDAPVAPDEVVSPVAVRAVPNMSVAPSHGSVPPHGSAPSSAAPHGTGDPH